MKVSDPTISIQKGKWWWARCRCEFAGETSWKTKIVGELTKKQASQYEKYRADLAARKRGKAVPGEPVQAPKPPAKVRAAAAEWAASLKAEAARLELEEQRERERYGSLGKNPTIGEYAFNYIEERKALGAISVGTYIDYLSYFKTKIDPEIGDVRLSDFTPRMANEWMAGMMNRGLAQNTVHKVYVLLKSILDTAQADGLMHTNPLRSKTAHNPKQVKPKPNPLDERSKRITGLFCDMDSTDAFSVAVRLALYTGMRRGEVCGLKWDCVDLDARTIRVRRQIVTANKTLLDKEAKRVRNGRAPLLERVKGSNTLYIKVPKTEDGARTITIPESVANVLKARRDKMMRECGSVFDFNEDFFVTGTPDGMPMAPDTITKRWIAFAKAHKLMGTEGRKPTYHDLRHTYATVALANGVDVKTVQTQLGHADASITLNVYAAADPVAALRAAKTVDDALARSMNAGKVVQFQRTGTEG